MLALFFFAAALRAPSRQAVPLPAETPVQVVVSGRTSTLKSIKLVDLGQTIPTTFSGNLLKNADGFSWYVSRHYALQTDYPVARAHFLLTLLELAYPHYLDMFGVPPPGIDQKRMAVIYGSSKATLKTALDADGISWNFAGGGITFDHYKVACNYPSGSLQYHQRYIMLHECVHLFQMCLHGTVRNTPPWFFEGIADWVSHHVWDSAHQRLTVCVLDKPTINDWYDNAYQTYAKEPFKASDILSGRRGGRELGFILVAYMNTDLRRRQLFRIWRDELIRINDQATIQENSDRLIEQLFGAAKLDADFNAWFHAHHPSFHYVDWGWEQDGDAMMSYGYPQSGPYSQTNLNFLPKDKAVYDPLVMDYPLEPQSDLVGPVSRGGDNPTVGCLVGFKETPNSGVAGLGLGVQGRSMLTVLVQKHSRLIVDGTALGGGTQSLDFPPAFMQAMGATYEVGLTIKFLDDGIEVTARTGTGGEIEEVRLVLSLGQAALSRLRLNPMAVISKNGRHWITPYPDAARQPPPNLDKPAPANRWRFAMEPQLYSLFRAAWRLGDDSPHSLVALRDLLLAAGEGHAAIDEADYEEKLKAVVADVRKCHAAPDAVQAGLKELTPPTG